MSEVDPLRALCDAARAAARRIAPAARAPKDAALASIARRLRAEADAGPRSEVLAANAADVEAARAAGTAPAMVDRLVLDPDRLRGIARAVEEIAQLDDPVGEVLGMKRR